MTQNAPCSELNGFKHAGICESFQNLIWRCARFIFFFTVHYQQIA